MRLRTLLAAVALAAASVIAGPAANAAPIDSGHFTDSFTDPPTDCDGTPMQVSGTVRGNFTFNQRGGKNVFPYYRESISGTDVFTNLETGGTYSDHFTANSRDHKVVDNGDGTITIYGQGSGSDVWRDQFGKVQLSDNGNIRYAFDIDYNGTPGNPGDDVEVPDSFRIVRDSTGTNIIDRDFCDDFREFTS
jgi:hypothetical protein